MARARTRKHKLKHETLMGICHILKKTRSFVCLLEFKLVILNKQSESKFNRTVTSSSYNLISRLQCFSDEETRNVNSNNLSLPIAICEEKQFLRLISSFITHKSTERTNAHFLPFSLSYSSLYVRTSQQHQYPPSVS